MKKAEDMTPQEIAQEINALEDQRSDIGRRLGELRKYHAANECPFHVGDVLVDRREQRSVVKEIFGNSKGYGPAYGMRGVYLKKDGTEGKRHCAFYSFDDWKKEGGSA